MFKTLSGLGFTAFLAIATSGCGASSGVASLPNSFLITNASPTTNTGGTSSGPLTGGDALDTEEANFLGLLNNYRAQNGLGPLSISNALTRAAAWLSQDMANQNYFSHTDLQGRDAFTRLSDFGYSASTMAENIAAGNSDAQSVFDQWKASPGHNANMLNSSVQAIGIGRAYSASSPYKWYWTTDFGSNANL